MIHGHIVMGLDFSSFIVSKLRSSSPGGNMYFTQVYDSTSAAVEIQPTFII